MGSRPITRFQEIQFPSQGVQVIAFGRHRYEGTREAAPAQVTVKLHHFTLTPESAAPDFSVQVDLDPIAALKLAAALTELAGKAVGAPPTDDNIPEPIAAAVEIDPPEVR
jgi:hypothetical protein